MRIENATGFEDFHGIREIPLGRRENEPIGELLGTHFESSARVVRGVSPILVAQSSFRRSQVIYELVEACFARESFSLVFENGLRGELAELPTLALDRGCSDRGGLTECRAVRGTGGGEPTQAGDSGEDIVERAVLPGEVFDVSDLDQVTNSPIVTIRRALRVELCGFIAGHVRGDRLLAHRDDFLPRSEKRGDGF